MVNRRYGSQWLVIFYSLWKSTWSFGLGQISSKRSSWAKDNHLLKDRKGNQQPWQVEEAVQLQSHENCNNINQINNNNENHHHHHHHPSILKPPHAGCHFQSTHPKSIETGLRKQKKRFFEGWYYRITIPQTNVSFAFIISIEDPFPGSSLSLVCHQIMGPNDEYLVQADQDHTKFWAYPHEQALGCIFEGDPSIRQVAGIIDNFSDTSVVQSGFQYSPTRFQGILKGHDGSLGGVLEGQGASGSCTYDFSIEILSGYGDSYQGQKSTAGWLASYAVFEPHWQITVADARATGRIVWKDSITYDFIDAPFYAEKNWGGSFPTKWYWCQCNSFTNYINSKCSLSVTTGGGIRKLPLGQKESLGMIAVHYNGTFYEATPWLGEMNWHVSSWGYWFMTGRSTGSQHPFEVQLQATCDVPGVKLRAPTEYDGMVYFCRDSFLAKITLSLWELDYDPLSKSFSRGKSILDEVTSDQAAVEIGGGPWWDDWKASSKMKQPMRGMVRLPYRLTNLRKRWFR
jgi:tocopherol cyclase